MRKKMDVVVNIVMQGNREDLDFGVASDLGCSGERVGYGWYTRVRDEMQTQGLIGGWILHICVEGRLVYREDIFL